MMNLLKKLAACGLSLTMILSLAACGGTDDTSSGESGGEPVKYLIGISQYGQHGSLDNCREGFLQGLEQAGLVEGTDFEVDYQNANFDDNQATQIGQMFSAEDADLMVGIATNSAIACFNAAEDKDIPVIFTAITDPVGAHLDAGNITGTSDALPVEGQLQLIRALQPDADTIGIVYTTSEANSVYSISVYEELATDYGFTIDAVGVTSQAEVTQAVDTLLSHGVDCLSNLTDNNVVGVLGAILAAAVTGWGTTYYLNLSLFFAFAMLYPEMRLLLFFIIPVKVKWLALFSGVLCLFGFVFGTWADRLSVLFSLLNFLIFFGGDFWRMAKQELRYAKNRRAWRNAGRNNWR